MPELLHCANCGDLRAVKIDLITEARVIKKFKSGALDSLPNEDDFGQAIQPSFPNLTEFTTPD